MQVNQLNKQHNAAKYTRTNKQEAVCYNQQPPYNQKQSACHNKLKFMKTQRPVCKLDKALPK